MKDTTHEEAMQNKLVTKATRKGFRAAAIGGCVYIGLDNRRVKNTELLRAFPELEGMDLRRTNEGYVSVHL